MLDAIHLLDRDAVLERIESELRFMLEECGVAALPKGDCVFFGPGDTRLILNVSIAAAGLFARVGAFPGRKDLIAQASRAARLVAHYQDGDGSWCYSPARGDHPVDTIIDSRCTGYIIEGLAADNAGASDPILTNAIACGWHYARIQLTENGKPRWSPEQTWPVDSYDVFQGTMTALTPRGPRTSSAAHEFCDGPSLCRQWNIPLQSVRKRQGQ